MDFLHRGHARCARCLSTRRPLAPVVLDLYPDDTAMVELSDRPLDGAARIAFRAARQADGRRRSIVGRWGGSWLESFFRRQTTFRRPPAAPEAPIYSENLNLTRS
jgi:hypothetical protein